MKFIEKQGLNEGEHLLELRSFNRHSAIYKITYSQTPDPKEIRERVKEITKPNILRGLAFGVFIETETLPKNLDDLFEAIDIQQKERSVWQWTIIQVNNPKIAIGFHTWMKVFLTSSFDENFSDLEDMGYPIEKFKKEKGKIMKILTSLQPRYQFEEYRDTQQDDLGNAGKPHS